ncbi:uncharacterized protein DSM5745_07640 [Aspergillus mulundensis]|uniref:Uncharacterized protein n=1 Tax=Aspergillus mulundensis TaxID=1810919 RepID=A0A3D8REX0_9EURO|nr:Uncharacterized protein DSM5745_07640 [Aspergillus mulundensis]RDW72468.1 Uncharacterized protein DSM5745_07640 [Aspergillus mulundensis]
MSDDEEEYYEYDDDEIFWVEEADPTAADDLAAAATYDPTFLEDPSIETADLYSDWEELTDDYYDDDPTAVRRLRAMGILPIDEPFHIDAPPSKRRKVADTLAADLTSFQGVAWRQPDDETDMVEIYAPGDGEKVALLKNWRDIFRDAKPAIKHLRGRIPSPKTLDIVSREQSESELDVPSLVEDNYEDEMVSSDAAEALPAKPLAAPVHPQVVIMNPPSELPVNSKKDKHGGPKGTLEPLKEDKGFAINGATAKMPAEKKTEEPTATAPRRGRKRKATVSMDDQPDQPGNSADTEARPRAKRVATSKASQAKASEATKSTSKSSGPVRRSARHKN